MTATISPSIAYDPATGLVYGVGRTPEEARDDAEWQAGVLVGGSPPWHSLETRPCTLDEAAQVDASNGPVSLRQLGRAA